MTGRPAVFHDVPTDCVQYIIRLYPSNDFLFTNICSACYDGHTIAGRRECEWLESILCVDIPVQMISCTDTNGKITPMRFRFRDKTGEIITVTIDKVLSEDQDRNKIGVNYSCDAVICGTRKTFSLWYNYFAHEWHLSRLHV